jgi:hypothetical protein
MTNQLSDIPKPVQTQHHFGQAVSIRGLKSDMQKVDGLNAKLAVFITSMVGSMWMAYLFSLIALTSLPAIITQTGWVAKGTFPTWLTSAGLILIVAWVAQTFIQLVLLSVIMVGQNVQSIASDARSEHTYDDTVKIIDALDIHTAGGIKDLRDSLAEYIDEKFQALSPK